MKIGERYDCSGIMCLSWRWSARLQMMGGNECSKNGKGNWQPGAALEGDL